MTSRLTLEETAQYLKMGCSTIYELLGGNRVLPHEAGRECRFDAAELDRGIKSLAPTLNGCNDYGLGPTRLRQREQK